MSDKRSQLSGRSALVTGASGFVGTRLCHRLRGAGVEVHGVSRMGSGHADVNRWWRADLADARETHSIMKEIDPDLVFHLASQVGGSRALDWVLPTVRNNLLSTVNLLTAAAEIGCDRFVVAGSMEEPLSSEGAVPRSPYAAAKFASTAYARMFHALYHLPVVALRVFMVYGPEQRDLTKVIPYVGLCLHRGQTPELASGRRLVDWVYVDDVTEAFVAAAAADGVEGRTIDVGTGKLVSVRTIVEKLTSLIDPSIEPRFGVLPDPPLEASPHADVDSSFSSLGWRPRVTLDEGLRATARWLGNISVDAKGSRADVGPAQERGGRRTSG